METLGKLFGSVGKVKIMRLFLFNPTTPFDIHDIEKRSAVSEREARADVHALEHAGFIEKKQFVKEIDHRGGFRRVKCRGWQLNESFMYLTDLRTLLIHSLLFKDSDIARRLARAGVLKFVAIAGVFIQSPESRIDLLIVGDRLKEKAIENVIRSLEAEIGKELRYSVLETIDFTYRLGVFDKLVRDVLDYPHRTILDRIGVKERPGNGTIV